MNDNYLYSFRLEVEEPERLDKLLSDYLSEYSRSTIQKWIISNNILINGRPCSQKEKIKSSCDVLVKIKPETEINLEPEKIDLDIIDETKDYIVVNKKSGMVTHIAPGNYRGTLQNAIYYRYPELSKVPRTGIIHRLDKDTTGIIVIARNISSHNNLNNQLQNKKFIKIYHAIITGVIEKPMEIDEPIGRHLINRKKMCVNKNGKSALSKIRPLKTFDMASHIQIQIITGRTHQIRVHLSHINKTIIGDKLYGFKKNIFTKFKNISESIDTNFFQYLHAYSLSFKDPTTEKIKTYQAEYPEKYSQLLNQFDLLKK